MLENFKIRARGHGGHFGATSLARQTGAVFALLAAAASSTDSDSGGTLFLGKNLLPWMVLALGGALVAGNLAAIVKPPATSKDGELGRAPVGRSLTMAGIGLVAAIWALASLVSG